MQEWAAVYQRTEDEIIKQIASRFWRSRIGGSSVSKAQLVIKTYVRLLAIGLSYFIMNFIAGMFALIRWFTILNTQLFF